MISKQVTYLENFVTDRRKDLIRRIADNRTRYITVVLEDIYQSQNASAVLRSCDCFGIQDVHIIDNHNHFEINPDVTKGSNKWLTLSKYAYDANNSITAINELRNKGYRIVATLPRHMNTAIEEFDLEAGKFALFFGNEHRGLSRTMIDSADEFIRIPMVGFTQSLNISVSAAIILYQMTSKIRNSSLDWQLTRDEKEELKLSWLKKSLRKPEIILREFLIKSSKNQQIDN